MLVSTAAHRIKRTYLFAVLTCGIAECELNGHPRRIRNNPKNNTQTIQHQDTKPDKDKKKNHTQLTSIDHINFQQNPP